MKNDSYGRPESVGVAVISRREENQSFTQSGIVPVELFTGPI